MAKQPDLTLVQIKERLSLACTLSAIHQVLAKLGLTYKKRRSMRPNKTGRTSPRPGGDGNAVRAGSTRHRLVFIDESAAKTNMTRLHGRSPKGERLVCHAPHGHWCTTTMISSVRRDGTTAWMTIEGATNTEVFQAYVREVPVPSQRPGDGVVMDNLGAHKNDLTLALIRQAGAEARFLPAYSPDLNPSEMTWRKVKALLRKAQARNHPGLLVAIASALNAVAPADALGWITRCEYSFI